MAEHYGEIMLMRVFRQPGPPISFSSAARLPPVTTETDDMKRTILTLLTAGMVSAAALTAKVAFAGPDAAEIAAFQKAAHGIEATIGADRPAARDFGQMAGRGQGA